jgi:SAM-dependent methyltransferase
MTNDRDSSVEFQRQRYNNEASEYDQHHGDKLSRLYRAKFYRNRLLDIKLSGKRILDGMCATGIDTGYMIDCGAIVVGLDISDTAAAMFREKWNCDCVVASMHQTEFADESFDAIYIAGGLHHALPLLTDVICECHRILKPSGHLCFMEPNRDTWLDAARRRWYSRDERFHDTERALSYKDDLKPHLSIGFEEEDVFLGGNIAYLLIAQSHLTKLPVRLKGILSYPLFVIERALNLLPGCPRLFLAARWRKGGKV